MINVYFFWMFEFGIKRVRVVFLGVSYFEFVSSEVYELLEVKRDDYVEIGLW